MIPSSSKLPLRKEFLAFRSKARRVVTPLATCYWLPTTKPARLAVIIPKKLSKLATTRNWLKRLTYDALWPRVKDNNLDCVIVYKPLALKKSLSTKTKMFAELQSLDLK